MHVASVYVWKEQSTIGLEGNSKNVQGNSKALSCSLDGNKCSVIKKGRKKRATWKNTRKYVFVTLDHPLVILGMVPNIHLHCRFSTSLQSQTSSFSSDLWRPSLGNDETAEQGFAEDGGNA